MTTTQTTKKKKKYQLRSDQLRATLDATKAVVAQAEEAWVAVGSPNCGPEVTAYRVARFAMFDAIEAWTKA